MFSKSLLALLFSFFFLIAAHARPVIVFDLDHTLVDTNHRIVEILKIIGEEKNIPELKNVAYWQVEALRQGHYEVLGLSLETQAKIFGTRSDGSHRTSWFGEKFYNDASLLKHDTALPGAVEFVKLLAEALSADILYLTGRTTTLFHDASLEQLKNLGFPTEHARLITKPDSYTGDTEDYKLEELAKLPKGTKILLIFDDAKRNANKFQKELAPNTIVVRLTRDVTNRTGLAEGIEQISNYVFNINGPALGDRTVTLNAEQLTRIVERAKRCAEALLP